MLKLGYSLVFAGALFLSIGAAQALTITSASLGQGQICTTSSCGTVLATLTGATQGSGSISLSGTTLSFNLQSLGATYSDASAATWTFAGTATVSGGGGFYFVTGGSVAVTLNGGAISTLAVGGTCLDPGDGTLSCGLSFTNLGGSPSRGYQSTVNLAAPEPSAAALLTGAGSLLALAASRRRSR